MIMVESIHWKISSCAIWYERPWYSSPLSRNHGCIITQRIIIFINKALSLLIWGWLSSFLYPRCSLLGWFYWWHDYQILSSNWTELRICSGNVLLNPTCYSQVIGNLFYLTIIRLNITFAIHSKPLYVLCNYLVPSRLHLKKSLSLVST